jgi:hypothetical protein
MLPEYNLGGIPLLDYKCMCRMFVQLGNRWGKSSAILIDRVLIIFRQFSLESISAIDKRAAFV